MALKIQFTFKEGTTIETIVVDASVSETHSFSTQVTDFPVEKGAAVSDNVRPNPATLRVEAFISDFPLANEGRVQASSGGIQGFQRPTPLLRRAMRTAAFRRGSFGLCEHSPCDFLSIRSPMFRPRASGLGRSSTFPTGRPGRLSSRFRTVRRGSG